MSAFRLLAFGGFSVLSGSTFAHYFHQLNSDTSTVDCKSFQYYEGRESGPEFKQKDWDYNWDLLEPKYISNEKTETFTDNNTNSDGANKKANPTATRHVILIRHGQYVCSQDGNHQRILTDLGRQQASLTGERLQSLGIKFDQVVISTMTRAQETGKIIGEFLPDVQQNHCSLLREGKPYPYEPSNATSQTIEWQRNLFRDSPRIEGAFRKYIHRADSEQKEDSYDLLVCHGNVIRYFVCRALQFPPEGWLRMSIAHCGITWICIRPNGKVSLRGVGHIGHLPSNLVTFS